MVLVSRHKIFDASVERNTLEKRNNIQTKGVLQLSTLNFLSSCYGSIHRPQLLTPGIPSPPHFFLCFALSEAFLRIMDDPVWPPYAVSRFVGVLACERFDPGTTGVYLVYMLAEG